MSTINERPILPHIAIETFNILDAQPMILGLSRLGVGQLSDTQPAPGDGWTDWAPHATSVSIHRGGVVEGLEVRPDTGVLTVTLRGVPLTVSTYVPTFMRDQPIRVLHVNDGARTVIYTGRILDVIAPRLPTSDATPMLQITAVDAHVDLDQTTRYGAMPPTGSETFAQRIARLTPTVPETVAIEQPDPADYAAPRLGRTVLESSLAAHFTLAATTAGALWYVAADGVTRFTPRRYDPATAITFIGNRDDGLDPDALRYSTESADFRGTLYFNRLRIHNVTAEPDPDNPGEWRSLEYDYYPVAIIGDGDELGQHAVTVTANEASGNNGRGMVEYISPAATFKPRAAAITWNAQEGIARVPDLEIGVSVRIPGDYITDPWERNLIVGISHTITPTRWMITLTLIGATA